MLKKILIVSLVLGVLFVNMNVLAGDIKIKINQDDPTSLEKEIPEIEEEIKINLPETGGIKGNGGPMLGVIQLELSDLNQVLTKNGFSSLNHNMLMYGGGGLGGFKQGSRFGGYGLAGRIVSNNNNKKAIFNFKYGGFLYDRALYASKKFDIAMGMLLGQGTANLNLIYDNPVTFDDIISSGKQNNLSKEFFIFEPRIVLHQQIATFIGLDITGGFLFGHDTGNLWQFADQKVVGPLNLIMSPSISFKLSFGF